MNEEKKACITLLNDNNMTEEKKIEKLRQMISDFRAEVQKSCPPDNDEDKDTRINGAIQVCDTILGYCDIILGYFDAHSLSAIKEMKILEEAAEKYAYNGLPEELKSQVKPIADEIIKNFITGAKWQKEQLMKDNPVIISAENFQTIIDKNYENGKEAMCEQMLKEAVEGEVVVPIYNGDNDWSAQVIIPGRYEIGDKLKIIILPQKEE